jgi:hypothetical protein
MRDDQIPPIRGESCDCPPGIGCASGQRKIVDNLPGVAPLVRDRQVLSLSIDFQAVPAGKLTLRDFSIVLAFGAASAVDRKDLPPVDQPTALRIE